jgi:hypothetical protein
MGYNLKMYDSILEHIVFLFCFAIFLCYASFLLHMVFWFFILCFELEFLCCCLWVMFWFGGYALFRKVIMLLSLYVWTTMVVGANMLAHDKHLSNKRTRKNKMFKLTIVSFFKIHCVISWTSLLIYGKYLLDIHHVSQEIVFKYKNHRFVYHVMPLAIGIIKIKCALVPPHVRSYSNYAHGLKHYPTLKTLSYFVKCIWRTGYIE